MWPELRLEISCDFGHPAFDAGLLMLPSIAIESSVCSGEVGPAHLGGSIAQHVTWSHRLRGTDGL